MSHITYYTNNQHDICAYRERICESHRPPRRDENNIRPSRRRLDRPIQPTAPHQDILAISAPTHTMASTSNQSGGYEALLKLVFHLHAFDDLDPEAQAPNATMYPAMNESKFIAAIKKLYGLVSKVCDTQNELDVETWHEVHNGLLCDKLWTLMERMDELHERVPGCVEIEAAADALRRLLSPSTWGGEDNAGEISCRLETNPFVAVDGA